MSSFMWRLTKTIFIYFRYWGFRTWKEAWEEARYKRSDFR